MNKNNQSETEDTRWNNFHKIGGISAIVIAFLLLGEIFVYSVLPNPVSTKEYMELFLKNSIFGLLHFDLLGMVSYIFFIPLIISLYTILRPNYESVMLIAIGLFFIGISVFYATNTGFSMLSLSKQYALAISESDRAIILASFQAMLTLFKVNAFMVSYVIVSASWIMISGAMLRSKLFSRFTAWMGILAGASGIIAEIIENTLKPLIMVAIFFYFLAIAFLFLWVVLTGKRLINYGTGSDKSLVKD